MTNDLLKKIKRQIEHSLQTTAGNSPYVVAIDGMSGSGKTTLGELLHQEFPYSNLFHIDDYFYPSTSEEIDKAQYSAYKASGGTMSLSKWRIANVNAFVSALYSTVKAKDSSLIVSISPAGQIDKTLNEAYADCRTWLRQSGYADIIIPQIYFGFEHQTQDFEKLLKQWASLPRHSSVRLMCGIPAYKCAKADAYAGTGKNEFVENSDILVRQLKSIRSNKNYSGFALFSYADLQRADCKTEITNLKNEIVK